MNRLIAIVGPTGTGKTAMGEALALEFGGEIISADSKQVYRGMDIGTAKELDLRVSQHLIDIREPGERFTVAEYQQLAYQAIDGCIDRGKQPFLVGCSMLYAESVINGYLFQEGRKSVEQQPRYRVLKLLPHLERAELRRRLAVRTDRWVEAGLLDEIRRLLDRGVSRRFLDHCGQEYRYFTAAVLGELAIEEAIRLTNISLNQYVKRQYTWWRRHQDVHQVADLNQAHQLVAQFLSLENVV